MWQYIRLIMWYPCFHIRPSCIWYTLAYMFLVYTYVGKYLQISSCIISRIRTTFIKNFLYTDLLYFNNYLNFTLNMSVLLRSLHYFIFRRRVVVSSSCVCFVLSYCRFSTFFSMSVVLSFLLSVTYKIVYMNHLNIMLCQFLAATISVAALETKVSILFTFFAVSVVKSLQFSVVYQIGYSKSDTSF